MTFEVEWFCLPGQASSARRWSDQWDALAASSNQRLPMLSHAWIEAFASATAEGGKAAEVHCAIAHADGRLLGVLPLVVRRRASAPWLPIHAATPYDDHTAFGDALRAADAPSGVLPALLQAAQRRFGRCLAEVALRGVSADSATASTDGIEPRGWRCIQAPRGQGSFLAVSSGTWGEYRAGLSKNFRQNLRKSENRLREANLEFRCEWLTGQDAHPDFLDTFIALESSGWKGRSGSAIGQDARRLEMYRRLVANLRQSGWLEWHLLLIDERAVAAHLAVRLGTSLVVVKIAYDEAFSRFSPGMLLFEKTVERAYADASIKEINCLTDMHWHKPWKMQGRPYFDCRFFPGTVAGMAAGWLPRISLSALRRLSGGSREAGGDDLPAA